MQTLQRLIHYLDAVNETTGRAVAWLTLGMVLVTFAVVVLRYAFNVGWIAMQESITDMHAAVFMLGAAYTLKHDGHVRVDILYRSPLGRAARRGSTCSDAVSAAAGVRIHRSGPAGTTSPAPGRCRRAPARRADCPGFTCSRAPSRRWPF